jgi:hypothetical protein
MDVRWPVCQLVMLVEHKRGKRWGREDERLLGSAPPRDPDGDLPSLALNVSVDVHSKCHHPKQPTRSSLQPEPDVGPIRLALRPPLSLSLSQRSSSGITRPVGGRRRRRGEKGRIVWRSVDGVELVSPSVERVRQETTILPRAGERGEDLAAYELAGLAAKGGGVVAEADDLLATAVRGRRRGRWEGEVRGGEEKREDGRCGDVAYGKGGRGREMEGGCVGRRAGGGRVGGVVARKDDWEEAVKGRHRVR